MIKQTTVSTGSKQQINNVDVSEMFTKNTFTNWMLELNSSYKETLKKMHGQKDDYYSR